VLFETHARACSRGLNRTQLAARKKPARVAAFLAPHNPNCAKCANPETTTAAFAAVVGAWSVAPARQSDSSSIIAA
jgi:hypothetical protein